MVVMAMILFMPEIKLMQPTPSELAQEMTISMLGMVEMMSVVAMAIIPYI